MPSPEFRPLSRNYGGKRPVYLSPGKKDQNFIFPPEFCCKYYHCYHSDLVAFIKQKTTDKV